MRRRWRSLTPSRAAIRATPLSLPAATACSMARKAATASACGESIAASPGAISGRHFRQGRNPATSASAALAKKRQRWRAGVRTRHTGRQ